MLKGLLKILLGLFIACLLLVGGIVTWLFTHEKEIKQRVIAEINKELTTPIQILPQDIDLTIWNVFPMASLNLKNILIRNPGNFNTQYVLSDTAIYIQSLKLSMNLLDIYHKKYALKKTTVDGVICNIAVNEEGKSNLSMVLKESGPKNKEKTYATQADSNAFQLEQVFLTNTKVGYYKKSEGLQVMTTIATSKFSANYLQGVYAIEVDIKGQLDRLTSNNTIYFNQKAIQLSGKFTDKNNNQTFTVSQCNLTVANLSVLVDGSLENKPSGLSMALKVNGQHLNIASLLSLSSAFKPSALSQYTSTGDFYFKGDVSGLYTGEEVPIININFGINNGTVNHTKSKLELHDLNLKGLYTNKNKGSLSMKHINGNIAGSTFSGSFTLENFNRPKINLNLKGELDLATIQDYLHLDTVQSMSGHLNFDVSYTGRIPNKKMPKGAICKGNLFLNNGNVQFKKSDLPWKNISTDLEFDNDVIHINASSCRFGKSDVAFSGDISQYMDYVLKENGKLKVEGDLKGNTLDLNEFLAGESTKSNKGPDTLTNIVLPTTLMANLSCQFKLFKYKKFDGTDLKLDIEAGNNQVLLEKFSIHTLEGKLIGNCLIDGNRDKDLWVDLKANLEKVNISTLFLCLDNFDQQTLTNKNIKGLLTAEINYTAPWSHQLSTDLKKVKAVAQVKIEKGELSHFAPLMSCSRFINSTALENIKFATLENNFTIENSNIHIPQVEIKNSALNFICYGNHSFNNDLDYHIQIKLRELLSKKLVPTKTDNDNFGEVADDGLSRSLFISMKGTIDKPIIAYDKKGMAKKIKADIKAEKQNMKELLKEEFGWFKKDSTINNKPSKENQKSKTPFKIKWDEQPEAPENNE